MARSPAAPALWLALCCAAHPAAANPPPPAPDAEMLEFLGRGDDADSELQHYLLSREQAAASQDAKPAPKRGSEKS